MPDFYPTNITDESFVRGPGRALAASMSSPFPTEINDVLNVSTFLAQPNWTNLGATKGGIGVTFNNSEEAFDVDQILAEIMSLPTGTEMSVATQLAEVTLDRLSFAWEGTPVTTQAATGGLEKKVSFGPFESYTQRRFAVAYRRPQTGKIRCTIFRKVQRSPQEATINYAKTGEQQSISVRWRALPDLSVPEPRERYVTMFDQV